MLSFSQKKFDKLSLQELHDIYALRSEVFVVEQDCVYQDIDGKDLNSIHVLGVENKKLVAYARILNRGLSYPNHASIGRIVVSPSYRGNKTGHSLVNFSIRTTQKAYKQTPIKISAQAHLENFYKEHHFKPTGDNYLEDGIPHIAMIYEEP
jgi:ElaA protein